MQIDVNVSSIDIRIDIDTEDCKSNSSGRKFGWHVIRDTIMSVYNEATVDIYAT